ncbi:MAG: response regulator transcription factor [Anaerolineae bacterium]|nr:response regulator transcription factor [Anaerolineae bacterium]
METKQSILVVDDEADIRDVIKLYLERAGYFVNTATDGEAALARIMRRQPDLIVLDLMMPKMGGLELTRMIRERWSIPIIMLTSRDEESDRVFGLELGADDYVTKPFSPREVTARVKAVLRRGTGLQGKANQETSIKRGDLTIDQATRMVTVKGQPVELTVKEFDLLRALAERPGQVFTREELLSQVWGYDFYGDTGTVTVHVRRLRKKIEPDPTHPQYILAVWGVGYKFADVGGNG